MKRDMLKWSMPVDRQNHFLGWITYADLEKAKSLREIMVPTAVTTAPETLLNEAMSMMFNSPIGNLAVIDDQEHLLGVLTFDIIRNILGKENIGLGELIVTGIAVRVPTLQLILQGAAPTAALAVILDALIGGVETWVTPRGLKALKSAQWQQ